LRLERCLPASVLGPPGPGGRRHGKLGVEPGHGLGHCLLYIKLHWCNLYSHKSTAKSGFWGECRHGVGIRLKGKGQLY